MINSGKGMYEEAIKLGIEKGGCAWENLNEPTQYKWEGLATAATEIKPPIFGYYPFIEAPVGKFSGENAMKRLTEAMTAPKLEEHNPKVKLQEKDKESFAGFVASKGNKLVNESNVFLEGCPVYSRVTGSLLGHYIGKTRDGGCCIDAGDGVDVEPFNLVTSNEKDIEEFQRVAAIEQWENTINHSNITVLATYLADQNVKNPM